MDTATTVAVFGFLGLVLSTAIGAVVTILTGRSEKHQAAETAMERTLRERIELRDEQLADKVAALETMTRDRDHWKNKAENNV